MHYDNQYKTQEQTHLESRYFDTLLCQAALKGACFKLYKFFFFRLLLCVSFLNADLFK